MSDQLLTSIPVATIKVGGTDIGVKEDDIEEIVIDTTYNLPSMATIRFYDHYFKWVDGSDFALGDTLAISLAPPKIFDEVTPAEIFSGEIVAIEPSLTAQGTHTFTIRAYDRSHRMHVGTKSRTFLDMSDSDIVGQLIREFSLSSGTIDMLPKQKYIIQNNLSDFEFLSMRAKRAGCHFSVVNNKVNFHKPGKVIRGPVLELGDDLRELSLRMSVARQAQKVNVRGWDFVAKSEILGSAVPAVTWRENGVSSAGGAAAKTAFSYNRISTLTNLVPQTKDEADAIAKAVASDQEGHFIEADGVSLGNPKLVAGVQVELKEMGKKYAGKYYVTSATHIYNASGYEVHFTISGRYPQTFSQLLTSGSTGTPETGAIHGVVVGIVTNLNDPDGLGRVKVRFPWLADAADKVESNWARLVAPSAGNNRGIYFLPEVNDEVLVAFEHGNPNYPYIVGGLWNGKDKVIEGNSVAAKGGEVIHRMIVSRTGHKIVLDDSKDKKSILIVDATGEQSIFIDSMKKDIVIKGGGNMSIDIRGNINIKAGANITMEATGSFKLDAASIEANSKALIKLDAKAAMEMKAATAVMIEATGALSAKGNLISIESKLATAVQGNPITLN